MSNAYEIKSQRLGWRKGLDKQARILGRIITLDETGLYLEADPALIEGAIESMDLTHGKPGSTPGVATRDFIPKLSQAELNRVRMTGKKAMGEQGTIVMEEEGELCFRGHGEENERLDSVRARRYVSVAALLNYISPDRPGILFPVKECLRRSSDPTVADESRLKRVCRYLIQRPREVMRFPWQYRERSVTVHCDSDFAGCPRTRKSTAGGVAHVGKHLLKAWSKTLPVLALSTGEAELMSVVRASVEALGLRAIYDDFGLKMNISIRSDATAAIGMVARLGLGRVRHLAVADLWVQGKAKSGELSFSKVDGKENPSDALTKNLDLETLEKHLRHMGTSRLEGRAAIAPQNKALEDSHSGGQTH